MSITAPDLNMKDVRIEGPQPEFSIDISPPPGVAPENVHIVTATDFSNGKFYVNIEDSKTSTSLINREYRIPSQLSDGKFIEIERKDGKTGERHLLATVPVKQIKEAGAIDIGAYLGYLNDHSQQNVTFPEFVAGEKWRLLGEQVKDQMGSTFQSTAVQLHLSPVLDTLKELPSLPFVPLALLRRR